VELIGELRKVCEGIPIHVISGSQPPAELLAAADGLLLKPFDTSLLWKLFEHEPEERKTSFLDPDEPAVSVEVLGKLRQMMTEQAIRDIYAAMVADLDKRIEALGAAIGRHDGDEVRRIGHAIKGGCSMAGAMQASRLGALLEAQDTGQDNHLDNSRTLLADLRAAARGLHRILENELPEASQQWTDRFELWLQTIIL
jgi:HPt (histidine-containing phosphotransfer) domain-containing protein